LNKLSRSEKTPHHKVDFQALDLSWQGVLQLSNKIAPALMMKYSGNLNIDDALLNLSSIKISNVWRIGVGCKPMVS